MKKKIFKEFIALFNALNSAGSLLAGYDKMQFSGELAKNEKEQAEIKEQFKLADELSVMDALEKAESFNIDNLFDEIEKNFYDHKTSIDIYTLSMLRNFANIILYYKTPENGVKYGTHLTICINFFKDYYKFDTAYSECTIAQRYLLKTRELLSFFLSKT